MKTIKYNKSKSTELYNRLNNAFKQSYDNFLLELSDVFEETNHLFNQRNLQLKKDTRKYFKADMSGQDLLTVKKIVDAEKEYQFQEFAMIYKAIRDNSELSKEYWNEEFVQTCKEKIQVSDQIEFELAIAIALTYDQYIVHGIQRAIDVFYGYEMVTKIVLVEDSKEPFIISNNFNQKELN